MTIRTGEPHVVETREQFMHDLNVTWLEIAQALPEEHRDRLVTNTNDRKQESVTTVEDLHPNDVEGYVDMQVSPNDVIEYVLEHRDREYTYLFDGVSVHRIVELDPVEADE